MPSAGAVRVCGNRQRAVYAGRPGFTDPLEFLPGAPAVQHIRRHAKAFARQRLAGQFQQRRCYRERMVPQVFWCAGVVQHGQNVMGFQCGAYASSHGLGAVRHQYLQVDAEFARHGHQALAESGRRGGRSHLGGGRPDRHVDHQMGRAGSDLLGKNGCDHLAFAVQVQRMLDPDQNVIGRTDVDGSAQAT